MDLLAHDSWDLGLHPYWRAALERLDAKLRAWEAEGTVARDRDRFAKDVARHRPYLVSRARRLIGQEADAQELVQQTIVRAIERQEQFQEGTHLRAWLTRILTNLFHDLLRSRSRHPTVAIDEDDLPPKPTIVRPDWVDIDMEDVRQALQQIPPNFAEVFSAYHFDGLNYARIAERFGLKPNTVATRLFRARALVRERLRERLRQKAGDSL